MCLAGRVGLEPTTRGLEFPCAIQLRQRPVRMVGPGGVEPRRQPVMSGPHLPLCYRPLIGDHPAARRAAASRQGTLQGDRFGTHGQTRTVTSLRRRILNTLCLPISPRGQYGGSCEIRTHGQFPVGGFRNLRASMSYLRRLRKELISLRLENLPRVDLK